MRAEDVEEVLSSLCGELPIDLGEVYGQTSHWEALVLAYQIQESRRRRQVASSLPDHTLAPHNALHSVNFIAGEDIVNTLGVYLRFSKLHTAFRQSEEQRTRAQQAKEDSENTFFDSLHSVRVLRKAFAYEREEEIEPRNEKLAELDKERALVAATEARKVERKAQIAARALAAAAHRAERDEERGDIPNPSEVSPEDVARLERLRASLLEAGSTFMFPSYLFSRIHASNHHVVAPDY